MEKFIQIASFSIVVILAIAVVIITLRTLAKINLELRKIREGNKRLYEKAKLCDQLHAFYQFKRKQSNICAPYPSPPWEAVDLYGLRFDDEVHLFYVIDEHFKAKDK